MRRLDWPKIGWLAITLVFIGAGQIIAAVAWGFGVPAGYYLALYEHCARPGDDGGGTGG